MKGISMKKTFWLFLLFALLSPTVTASPPQLPSVSHYSLKMSLSPKEGKLEAVAMMDVTNRTDHSVSELPFLLYRLLDVQRLSDDKGAPLKFDQTIVKLGSTNLQANFIAVHLSEPIAAGMTRRISVNYQGSIFGYPEVMSYVNDRISEKYSLIRPDALAYPVLAEATFEGFRSAYNAKFTYDVTTSVPDGYVVACGGVQVNNSSKEGRTAFAFTSKVPTARIDVAVAQFKQLKDEARKLSIYVLPEDEKNALEILNGASRVVSLYSTMFGDLKDYQGFTVIEIPDGWGSQASDYYILQAAAAFKDLKKIFEVYHEIAHSWNAKANAEVQRTRWFDEAFAMYFQALAVREFEGQQAYLAEMERDRDSFIRRTQRDRKNFETPIAEYGKYDLGANSYNKGAWSLYVLHQLVGEDQFRQIIRAFLAEFDDKPAGFKDFQHVAERVSRRDLRKYFNEWIFGATSSQLLLDKVPVTEIVKRY